MRRIIDWIALKAGFIRKEEQKRLEATISELRLAISREVSTTRSIIAQHVKFRPSHNTNIPYSMILNMSIDPSFVKGCLDGHEIYASERIVSRFSDLMKEIFTQEGISQAHMWMNGQESVWKASQVVEVDKRSLIVVLDCAKGEPVGAVELEAAVEIITSAMDYSPREKWLNIPDDLSVFDESD